MGWMRQWNFETCLGTSPRSTPVFKHSTREVRSVNKNILVTQPPKLGPYDYHMMVIGSLLCRLGLANPVIMYSGTSQMGLVRSQY